MFDQVCEKIYDATHMGFAYRRRAEELISWKRFSEFCSLGVAPGLILAGLKFDNKEILGWSLLVSGLLSIAAWVWKILSFSYSLDQQLEVSKSLPSICENYKSQLKRLIANVDWNNLKPETNKEILYLMERISELRKEIETKQIHVSELINIWAQQQTMIKEKAICSSCNQKWIQDHEYTDVEIKNALKMIADNNPICPRCCQSISKEKK